MAPRHVKHIGLGIYRRTPRLVKKYSSTFGSYPHYGKIDPLCASKARWYSHCHRVPERLAHLYQSCPNNTRCIRSLPLSQTTLRHLRHFSYTVSTFFILFQFYILFLLPLDHSISAIYTPHIPGKQPGSFVYLTLQGPREVRS